MLTTTSETFGSAKASVLRRVTTTTFLHSGFLIRSCTMRPPTFPVAPSTIAEFFENDDSPWNLMMAAALIYCLPPIAIFYALRRYIAAGLTMGGVKG